MKLQVYNYPDTYRGPTTITIQSPNKSAPQEDIKPLYSVPGCIADNSSVPAGNSCVSAGSSGLHTWVRMNMISSLNGKIVGHSQKSNPLSNICDRTILKTIRSMSDAVVVGANTVRQEGQHLTLPAKLCILTQSGDLSGHKIEHNLIAGNVFVFTYEKSIKVVQQCLPGASIYTLDADSSPVHVLKILHSLGLKNIVIEGGANLVTQFLNASLIDEVCVTTAPIFVADDLKNMPHTRVLTKFKPYLLAQDTEGYIYQRLIK